MRLRISNYTFLKSNSITKKPNIKLKTSGRKTLSLRAVPRRSNTFQIMTHTQE